MAAAGFDARVKERGAFPGLGFADEPPVLFADGGGPDRLFDGVVIDADAAILYGKLPGNLRCYFFNFCIK